MSRINTFRNWIIFTEWTSAFPLWFGLCRNLFLGTSSFGIAYCLCESCCMACVSISEFQHSGRLGLGERESIPGFYIVGKQHHVFSIFNFFLRPILTCLLFMYTLLTYSSIRVHNSRLGLAQFRVIRMWCRQSVGLVHGSGSWSTEQRSFALHQEKRVKERQSP